MLISGSNASDLGPRMVSIGAIRIASFCRRPADKSHRQELARERHLSSWIRQPLNEADVTEICLATRGISRPLLIRAASRQLPSTLLLLLLLELLLLLMLRMLMSL